MSPRIGPALALLVLTGALAAVLVTTTPWHTLDRPPGGPTAVSAARDFTAQQIHRERSFHRALRPASYVGLAVGWLVAAVLGFTPLGARLVEFVGRPFGGGWAWRVLVGSLALAVIGQLASLPFAAYSEIVLRRYGLSTQQWGGWTADLLKGFGIGTAITTVTLLGFYAVVRAAPTTWWAWTAPAAAALVIVLSFLYPVVVEPAFNKFTPMPGGPLRTSLLTMARADHVPARDVLIADASRRTTALNAYVSGFGSTRRIVVYDTLLHKAPPQEVRLIVAHELGHAKRNDVLHGTLIGALGAAAACCLLYLLGTWPALTRRAGVASIGDATSVALLLAIVATGSLLSMPVQSLVSRRIEARADVHSLDLTQDPDTFIEVEKRLSVTNLSDLNPNPVVYALFFDHPSGPERIALARNWQRLHQR